jgi:hypothetical protein
MGGLSAVELLRLPFRLHGIRLGQPVDRSRAVPGSSVRVGLGERSAAEIVS